MSVTILHGMFKRYHVDIMSASEDTNCIFNFFFLVMSVFFYNNLLMEYNSFSILSSKPTQLHILVVSKLTK